MLRLRELRAARWVDWGKYERNSWVFAWSAAAIGLVIRIHRIMRDVAVRVKQRIAAVLELEQHAQQVTGAAQFNVVLLGAEGLCFEI